MQGKSFHNQARIVLFTEWNFLCQKTTVKMKESEKIDKYLDLARELESLLNMKLTEIPIVVGALWTGPKSLRKEIGGIRDQRVYCDITNHSIIKICKNTQESPGDLRKLIVTKTTVKHNQLKWSETLIRKSKKNSQGVK